MDDFFWILFLIFFGIPILIANLSACFLCANAARDKGRGGGWFWLAFFGTPVLATVLLIALGDTEEKRTERIIEEEELRKLVRHKNAHQETTPERSFNPSAKTIGEMYKR